MKRYIEKTVSKIEAVQWTNDNLSEATAFCKDKNGWFSGGVNGQTGCFFIYPPNSNRIDIKKGDYIIKDSDGTLRGCSATIFEEKYEAIDDKDIKVGKSIEEQLLEEYDR